MTAVGRNVPRIDRLANQECIGSAEIVGSSQIRLSGANTVPTRCACLPLREYSFRQITPRPEPVLRVDLANPARGCKALGDLGAATATMTRRPQPLGIEQRILEYQRHSTTLSENCQLAAVALLIGGCKPQSRNRRAQVRPLDLNPPHQGRFLVGRQRVVGNSRVDPNQP